MRTLFAALVALLASSPAFAQFSNLTVTPTHPTAGLRLNWTGPGGTINVNRWTDANPTPAVIGTVTGATYTDSTPVVNTIYYYSVSQGAASSNTFMGVVSDILQPFNCPPMVPVAPGLLGVDRTETFTAADGTTVSFTIQAPIPANIVTTRNVAPCNGAPGCSDFNNINQAMKDVVAGGITQLQAGDYHLDNRPTAVGAGLVWPIWNTGSFDFNISTNAAQDVILAGAAVASGAEPTTRIFFNQDPAHAGSVAGLVTGGNRVLIRNITFDWDFPNAIPGTMMTATTTQCMALTGAPNCQLFNVTNPTYYIPDPTNPPPIYFLDAYNFTARTYDLRAGGRQGAPCIPPSTPCPFNPNFAMDGLYFYAISPLINAILLPDGTPSIFMIKTGGALEPGTDAFNQSFENIRVYGGGGPGLIQGAHSKGLRVSNLKIERKPDSSLAPGEQPRFISLIGDSDSNGSQGDVLIENSQFGYVEDDTYYMRGSTAQMQTLFSTSSFGMDAGLLINHAPSDCVGTCPNDFMRFTDPYTYKQLGTMPQVTWTKQSCVVPTQCQSGQMWRFTFPPISDLASYIGLPSNLLPWFAQPAWSAPNFAIRNSCSHDTHGRLAFLNWNGLVENNVLANGYFGPLVAAINHSIPIPAPPPPPALPFTTFIDGPGAQNLIFRNNKIIGANYGQTDLKTIWSPTVVSNNFTQTGWGTAAIQIDGIGLDGFYSPPVAMKDFVITGNFISNTPGECILATSITNLVVTGNICVDANAIPFTAGFDATFCGGFSQGWNGVGANQPWCLAKTAAQGSIMLVNNANVTSTPNQFLGTSIGTVFTFDTSTVVENEYHQRPAFPLMG